MAMSGPCIKCQSPLIHAPGKCALEWALKPLGASGVCSVSPGEAPVPYRPVPSWGPCRQAVCPGTAQQPPELAPLRALLQGRVRAATEASYRGKIKQNWHLVLIRDLILFFFFLHLALSAVF